MSAGIRYSLSLADMNALDRLECLELNGAIVLRSASRLAEIPSVDCSSASVCFGFAPRTCAFVTVAGS
jgi:hypothetical protein